jgi:flagellar protein FliT
MSALAMYETMRALSAQMTEAAVACDWDRLVGLEQDCAGLARQLEANGDTVPLSDAERARKRELILQILADDAEVRRHTEPWMEQVKGFLGAGTRQRDLQRTYGLK